MYFIRPCVDIRDRCFICAVSFMNFTMTLRYSLIGNLFYCSVDLRLYFQALSIYPQFAFTNLSDKVILQPC